MLRELMKDTIYGRLGSLRSAPKGWSVRNCPVCIYRGHNADTRGRFGIRVEPDGSIIAHCFNCALNTRYTPTRLLSENLVSFLKNLGVNQEDIKKLKFQAFREKEAGEIFKNPKLRDDPRTKWGEYALPPDSFPIYTWLEMGLEDEQFIKVANYCIDRKLDLREVYWSPDGESMMSRRAILPFVYRGTNVGYTARLAVEAPVKGLNKYHSHSPADFVYNLDAQIPEHPFIILCEGVVDAYLVSGVSSQGALQPGQVEIINTLRKRVIVCPDRDKAGQQLIDVALDNGWDVCFPNWAPDVKDAANAVQKYGRLLTVRSILETATNNTITIQLKRKMDFYEGRDK